MLVGVEHNECEPTGQIAQGVSRFANEKYVIVELTCLRCAYVFWSGRKDALALAESKGFTVA